MSTSRDEIDKEIAAMLADRYLFAVAEDSAVHARAAAQIHERIVELVVENIEHRMICCPASYLPGDPEPERHKKCHYAAMAIRILTKGPEHV